MLDNDDFAPTFQIHQMGTLQHKNRTYYVQFNIYLPESSHLYHHLDPTESIVKYQIVKNILMYF